MSSTNDVQSKINELKEAISHSEDFRSPRAQITHQNLFIGPHVAEVEQNINLRHQIGTQQKRINELEQRVERSVYIIFPLVHSLNSS